MTNELRERAFAPVLVMICLIVSLISSLGAPLIPTIARDLHASIASTQWSLTVTLLVGAVASPVVGRLGDGRERKRVMVTCMALVTIGGLLAATAANVWVLICGRAMQGMGLAVMPLTMAAAREHLSADDAPALIARLSVVAAVGVGLGYPITGLLAEHGGYEAAFWFGVVFSASACAMTILFVPTPRQRLANDPVDSVGASLVCSGVLALLLALVQASTWGWVDYRTIGLFLVSCALLAIWVRQALAAAHPLVDLTLLRHRVVVSANVAGMTLGIAMYTSIVLITQFVQTPTSTGFGFGASTFIAGLTLVPLSIASFLASNSMARIQRRLGTRAVVPIGSLLLGASCVFFGLTGHHLWQAFVMFALAGAGLGFTFAAMPRLIVLAVPPEETSSSMSFYQVTRYVGFAIGSSLSVTLLHTFGSHGIPTYGAYRSTFFVAFGLTLATAILAWILTGPIGEADAAPPDIDELDFEEGIIGSAGLQMLDDVAQPAPATGALTASSPAASRKGRRRR